MPNLVTASYSDWTPFLELDWTFCCWNGPSFLPSVQMSSDSALPLVPSMLREAIYYIRDIISMLFGWMSDLNFWRILKLSSMSLSIILLNRDEHVSVSKSV